MSFLLLQFMCPRSNDYSSSITGGLFESEYSADQAEHCHLGDEVAVRAQSVLTGDKRENFITRKCSSVFKKDINSLITSYYIKMAMIITTSD